MELSVIIVSWNSVNYLRSCLRSLYRETREVGFEVIVVDNDSQDDCKSILREFPTVHLIEAQANLGFARANNLGYCRSTGEVLLFLNPDTEIIGDDIGKMLAYLRSHPAVGAVGVRLLNSDGSVQTSCVQAFPTVWNQMLDSEFLRRLFPTSRLWGMRALFDAQAVDADVVSGACLMVKRNVFEKVGRFGEEYFMYADDLDLSYKIRQVGYAIHCLNGCKAVHHGGKSSGQRADNFSDLLKRDSIALFFRKTRGSSYCAVYRVAMTAIALLRLSLVICLMPLAGAGLLQGEAPQSVFRKWLKILGWSLGLKRPQGIVGSPAGI